MVGAHISKNLTNEQVEAYNILSAFYGVCTTAHSLWVI